MKILLVLTRANVGGVQIFVINLARGLQAQGHEVSVAAGAGEFLPTELERIGVPFFYFKHLSRGHNPFSGWLFIRELNKFLRMYSFDVVHFNSSNTLFGLLSLRGLKLRPKTVFTVHGLSVLDQNYQANFLIKNFYRRIFKFFLCRLDRTVFVSRANLDQALASGLVNKNKFISQNESVNNLLVIYNGFNEQKNKQLARPSARNFLSAATETDLTGAYLIASVGRLSYQKNHEFTLKVFPEILKIKPEARLIIIGSGPDEQKLRALSDRLGLRGKVFILTNINQAAAYLNGFDFFVLASRYEGLPFVLIEATAAGLPILASRVSGNGEALGGEEAQKEEAQKEESQKEEAQKEAAQLYDLNNEREFIAKFSALINHPDLLAGVKESNRRRASEFSLDRMVEKYLDIYRC